ncbi:conserved protein of unknown function [Vibrio tapetis subsp. tapetis]|uniref:Uncharacterized protein n=1 Tax=Vibrio tapetis subsp. tapetis TaxID=1671868 RepID=A0A2N8Z927_9VIBR|nr:conserved protein of unknown function [Vibrio tapetis subsp. tapetis]
MINHAVFFAPLRFSAGTLLVMASFRFHYTHVTACQFFHANKAMSLRVTLFGFFTARAAKDITSMREGDGFTYDWVERNLLIADGQKVLNLAVEFGFHFSQRSDF